MASQRRFRCAGDPRYDFTLSVLRENVVAVLHLRVSPEPALRVVSLRRVVRHSGRAKRVGRRVIIERAPSSRCVGLRANHATLPQSKRRRLFVLSRLRQSRDRHHALYSVSSTLLWSVRASSTIHSRTQLTLSIRCAIRQSACGSFCQKVRSIFLALLRMLAQSVDQIERFYARNLLLSKEMAKNLQCFGEQLDK